MIDNYPVVKTLLVMLLIVPVESEIFKSFPVYVELSGQFERAYVVIQLYGSDIIAYY